MRLSSVTAAAVLAITCTTTSVQAQCGQACQSCECSSTPALDAFCAGYHANVDWPARYIPAARRSVNSVYAAMTHNGWRRQNLLGTYHFDPDTNELTEAGRLKANWILTQTPQHRRSIFVERAKNESLTAARVASVHSWGRGMSPAVGAVDVNDTHIVAEGHSAGVVDKVFAAFHTNQRPPVLPAASGSSSDSGSAQ